MQIRESGEDYLEAILMLQKRNGQVRSIDICNELGFSKPTVSVAMKNFRENGYINMDEDYLITLTEKGRAIAESVYERHVVIAKFLSAIGVDEKTALEDACKIEHDLSDETFRCMKEHYKKISE
ncbi:MAG: metal-dependent transcriptional regulator [Oscillospiraceae bacterium]|nr:metal-dependent transcriptional regulator [Oscillospiraceae bacterium]MBQ6878251.1 metal-dependent transcriptional regulator [Oscillospiraceae bacterium]